MYMKILLAGGGSGGHVTPLKAIAQQLRLKQPDVQLLVLTDRSFSDRAEQVFADMEHIPITAIFAGKFRRYHSRSFWWHITHLPTLLKNIRDIVYIGIGFGQSLVYMMRERPDVVFCKGGFVCVPIGYVARFLKIQLVIHDSDTKPGLTNRLLARFAHCIATGMPAEFYPYEPQRIVYTGMPVAGEYQPLSAKQQATHKQQLGFHANQKIILLTGGGNGSESLNRQLDQVAGELLQQGWALVQMAGHGKAAQSREVRLKLPKALQQLWQIEEFADMIPRLLAADIVITRTSANTLQECANAKKAVIGIASQHLADQVLNSQYFASHQAIWELDEALMNHDGSDLLAAIHALHKASTARQQAEKLYSVFAKPYAAATIADLIFTSKE